MPSPREIRQRAIEEVVRRRGSNLSLVREKLARSKPYPWTDHMITIAVDGWERALLSEARVKEAEGLLQRVAGEELINAVDSRPWHDAIAEARQFLNPKAQEGRE